MTASADIITKTNDSALSVPLQSVAARAPSTSSSMKGEKRKDAEARYKADQDGFVEIVFVRRAAARRSRSRSRPASRATS